MLKSFTFALFIVLCLSLSPAFSQNVPVRSNTMALPPFSIHLLENLTSDRDKFVVTIQLMDLNVPGIQVRLRLRMESFSRSLQTRRNTPTTVYDLSPGVPLRLTNQDLQEYFSEQNLELTNIDLSYYRNHTTVPEDRYRVWFEVYEVLSGAYVSRNEIAANMHIVEHDVPLINQPQHDSKIYLENLQRVLFQWAPRHYGAGMQTEYKLQIVEIPPGLRSSPEQVMASSLVPFFEATTRATSFVYDFSCPELKLGYTYAYRIQAYQVGMDVGLSMFKNKGFTPTQWFTFSQKCPPVRNVQIEKVNQFTIKASYMDHPLYENVVITRRLHRDDAIWYDVKGHQQNLIVLTELKPQTTYQYKIKAICVIEESDYTRVDTFTTLPLPAPTYECGAESDVFVITNFTPLRELKVGDMTRVGMDRWEFRIAKITASKGNGVFDGYGYKYIPMFGNVGILQRFEGVQFNELYEVMSDQGFFVSVYDWGEGGIGELGGETGDDPNVSKDTTYEVPIVITGNTTATLTDSAGNRIEDTTLPPITVTVSDPDGGKIVISVNELPAVIKDENGSEYVVDKDGEIIGPNKQIPNSNMEDSTALYVLYNNIRYADGGKIVVPKASEKSIQIFACDSKGTILKDSIEWKGRISYDQLDTFATYSISKITSDKGDRISVTLGKLACNITVFVVDGYFSRCPETGTYTNKYGYDEMEVAHSMDDHISVASNGETYVKLNISGKKDLSLLYFDVDTNIVKIEMTADPKILKIRAGDFVKRIESLKIATQSNKTAFFAQITICVYSELTVDSTQFYGIYKSGDLTTRPPSLNTDLIKQKANKYLKYLTVSIKNVLPISYEAVDFDKNNNGVIDYYNDGDNPETGEIYKHLTKIDASYTSIVLIKNGINDIWRIEKSVKIGDTIVNITSNTKYLNAKEMYTISSPQGTHAETFKIVSASNSQLIIDTDPRTPGNQGFTFVHPKIPGNDSLSHCIIASHKIAGLSAKPKRNRPALVVGATEKEVGCIFSHELMHGHKLHDVNNNTNNMHYTVSISTITLNPFTFKNQRIVVTGTPTQTDDIQNQWNTIHRDSKTPK